MMKKFGKYLYMTTIGIVGLVGIHGTISANYTPTLKDIEMIDTVEDQITLLSKDTKDTWNFFYQFKILSEKFRNDEQLHYILSELTKKVYTQLEEKKIIAKENSKESKAALVEKFLPGVNDDEEILERCKKYYPLLDDISFAYDFPTALTVATWYRETACRFYLPGNGDGPFQIVTKDYGTGELTEELFVQTVIDYISFAENKFKRYENKINVDLDYQNIDLESVMNYGALYNGAKYSSGIMIPLNPRYLFDKYAGEHVDAKRYGVRPYMLKILDRELKNHY